MSDYYQPPLLFRQNAIRRFQPSLPTIESVCNINSLTSDSSTSATSYTTSQLFHSIAASNSSTPRSSWLLHPDTSKDTQVLNKSCSLNRVNVKSNYWKIPDNDMNLTSMAVNTDQQPFKDSTTLAIASGNNTSNLFIYQLNLFKHHLIHHTTITLPNIHTMRWVPNNSNYLITGNNKGYAHLVSIPNNINSDEEEEEAAEICKRFNHRKHLKNHSERYSTSPIKKLEFYNQENNLLSIFNNHLYHWDIKDCTSQSKPTPLSIANIPGIQDFDIIPNHPSSSTIAISGKFGVSLFDLRMGKFNIPMGSSELSYRELSSNIIKWNPNNEYVFASGHGDGIVRLWDIRKQESYASLQGHNDYEIKNIQWDNNGDLFTGGRDGNIIHWDLTSDNNKVNSDNFTKCGLREGFNSVKFNPETNTLEETLSQRQCGTVLPASNTNIVDMASVRHNGEVKVLSIDGSSFLGVHSKITEAVDIRISSEKVYYTEEDVRDLLLSSQDALDISSRSGSDESLVIEPLSVAYKSSPLASPAVSSSDTLVTSSSLVEQHKQHNDDASVIDIDEDEFEPKHTIIDVDDDDNDFQFFNTSSPMARSFSTEESPSPNTSSINDSAESISTMATEVAEEEEEEHISGMKPSLSFNVTDFFSSLVSTEGPITFPQSLQL
ncbi:DSE1 [[Candida] subhashii]|uniref:DSE1 n=1 Tax=[Candida] subhashii TaxID=561895 RepID=A0A8J5QPM5_9ASCO|nr:DSE1 [[Candida] subhashii]KAG7665289.1 DSE1 [[Candida] subhashii]